MIELLLVMMGYFIGVWKVLGLVLCGKELK